MVALALFALTSLMAVLQRGPSHVVQNYSGTDAALHHFWMWVPSQLPANQVQDLSLDEVA